MLHKTLLAAMAAMLAFAAVGMAVAPTEAFSENKFIETWNANAGVLQRTRDRLQANPTKRQIVRSVREMARAENRIVMWLRDHRATACQRPWSDRMVLRGTEARKLFKAAARSAEDWRFGVALRQLERGLQSAAAMGRAATRMVETCP